ncbi:enoyl-CoA hydratase-related protein [Bosea rubneri]|uniref:Enoyl-CoA hydratase-related protein n=1 Tax=Bosea rubneri TaxID=3075434 RepID=A0ABU3S4V0_9HYPH|nr:enoyl-CoA hydratase-related protein [Bosea sp. ZW T0_25]MDU0339799.1 enoyl-CoA hydratase-related protein [Bosea sp. ZW T0_25]
MLMSAILVETRGNIVHLTLNRPPVNALSLALCTEIADIFEQTSERTDVQCAVLGATGAQAFCAGLDLNEFRTHKAEDDEAHAAVVRRVFSAIRNCAIPVIAAVNGPALGAGCVIASACDIRLAAENANFGLPEINVGSCAGITHMGRHLPQGLLRRMVFTGKPIGAQEAWRAGFVDSVFPLSDLGDAARTLADVIASKAPLALRMGKEALNRVEFLSVEDGYALEQGYSLRLLHTEDAREATQAAIEKRQPLFAGR